MKNRLASIGCFKRMIVFRKQIILVITIILAVLISLSLHWRILEDYTWPRIIYVSRNLDVIGSISLALGINPIRFREILYFAFDLFSLIIIILAQRKFGLLEKNSLGTLLGIFAILYFAFYPYNKLTDAGFQGIYVLMTLISAITIYALTSITKAESLGESTRYTIILSLIIFIIFIVVGQWDPRILLYPLTLIFVFTLILFFISLIYKKLFFMSLRLAILLVSLSTILYFVGNIRIKLAESLNPTVPLNLDAFRGRYEIFYLVSGNSWILVHLPAKQVILISFFSILMLLAFSALFFSSSLRGSKYVNYINKKILLIGLSLILTYVMILFFELNIHMFLKFLLTSDEGLLLLNKFTPIRDLLIMFRIPRFMDFTNKTVISLLLIILGVLLKEKGDIKVDKALKIFIVATMISSVLLPLANAFMIYPIVKEGAIFNHNPESAEVVGIPYKALERNFFIANWNKEKMLLTAFLRGGIEVGSLELYDNGVISSMVKAFTNAFSKLNVSVETFNIGKYFAIIKFNQNVKIGRPLLVPQGLYLGSKVWNRGYVPIYLDQIMPRETVRNLMKLEIPVIIYKNKQITSKNLAIWLLLNNVIAGTDNREVRILIPSLYAQTFTPSLKYWSPGFIGDPHHGIFYEPGKYEYDYTYCLEWGVIQGRAVEKSLRIPFDLKVSGKYVVMARLMSTGRGLLQFYMDGKNYGSLRVSKTENIDSKMGFTWVNICNIRLERGTHLLEIHWFPEKKGKSISTIYLNLIVLIPEKLWQEALNYSLDYVNTHGVNLSSLPNITKKSLINVKESEINYPFLGKEFNINITATNVEKGVSWVFVIRLPWGYSIKISGSNIAEAFPVPVDYVKTGIFVIPQSNKLSIQVRGYQGYATPMDLIKIFTTYMIVMLSLYSIIHYARRILKRYNLDLDIKSKVKNKIHNILNLETRMK